MREVCLPVTAFLGLILIAGCGGGDRAQVAPGTLQVGLVFDIGGIGDKSFNDSAYNARRQACTIVSRRGQSYRRCLSRWTCATRRALSLRRR